MKRYIVIILITLHIVSSNLYATKSILQKNDFNLNMNICSFHEYPEEHVHHHYHNGSKHSHSHNHSQINMSFVDYYTDTQNTNPFNYLKLKHVFSEETSWIPNPILESLFRPPKV